jgi:hypothetical protein
VPPKAQVLQFKITLQEVSPPIWRRLLVPASYTFWDFHVAIQDAMGWEDMHLHAFHASGRAEGPRIEIGIPDEDVVAGQIVIAGWELAIAEVFRGPGIKMDYDYDFGDGWCHEVVLEDTAAALRGRKYPRCVDGARACPPEDCGGPGGYTRLLDIISDPQHEEFEQMREWLGGAFDPESFDVRRIRFDNPEARWARAFGE